MVSNKISTTFQPLATATFSSAKVYNNLLNGSSPA